MKALSPWRTLVPAVLASLVILATGARCRATSWEPAPDIPIPPADQILKTLRKEHPRLLATGADFDRLGKQMASDPLLIKWHEGLQASGEKILAAAPSKYEIPDGVRLLDTSRQVLNRVLTLAMLYRLDHDKRYADRAWQELQAAAEFKDWNPRHFLDTAEMTCAFAIGYDWLFDVLTPEQRETLRSAMVEKGIKPAMEVQDQHGWWSASHQNWNQVCNGGIGMGALALADVEPRMAGKFLHAALESIQLAMAEYGPDGAWIEGPGYWNYATKYNVFILAALQTALGTDFGLSKIKGFSEAGTFPIYVSGPLGLTFNYADAFPGPMREGAMFWLGRQFDRPEFARHQAEFSRGGALDMLWYDPTLVSKPGPSLPLDKYYTHDQVVSMRSAWDDPNALFVGFKGGDNTASHGHLDLGSFVFDAYGVRWANDIGSDNYNFPEYFGKQRFTYYRLRAEGHNTLVINPEPAPDQDPHAESAIIKFSPAAGNPFAIADLSDAYAKNAVKVRRGIAMPGRKQLLVQDEVQAKAAADLWWFMHTTAEIEIGPDGTTATLKQGKSRLMARILSPGKAVFKVMKAEPLPNSAHPDHNGNNDKFRKLAIELQGTKDVCLAVLLTPYWEGEPEPASVVKVRPLDEW